MKKTIAALVHVQELLGTFLLCMFFAAILIQIFARYAAIPLLWTEELANYSFIWAVFMGASVMVFNRAHFAFSFFSSRFSGKSGFVYTLFVSAVMLCFTVPMTVYGVDIVLEFWDYNWITLDWMKMGYTWMCIPVSGATMSVYILSNAVEDLAGMRREVRS